MGSDLSDSPPDGALVRLHVLTGTRAGERLVLPGPTVTVGRTPDSDLRFDPEAERAVSGRHAVLLLRDGAWHVRDAGSRNGTWVNGERALGEVPLRPGDRVRFGAEGPLVEVGDPAAERRRAAALHRGGRTRDVSLALGLALVGVLAASLYVSARQRDAFDAERTALRLRVDSVREAGERTAESLELQLAALSDALRRSQERVRAMEAAVTGAQARGESAELPRLRRELREATETLRGQQGAAALDFRSIQQRNRRAIAKIYAEFDDGTVVTGTAFAVRPDATLLTNRHLVRAPDGGAEPRRVAIQFSDSEQVWPARVLAVATDADLAVVKVDNILGEVPVVQPLNVRPDTLAPGAPVAVLGFPLGGLSSGEGDRLVRPLVSAGVIRSLRPGRLEVQGYGAVGASGSPILDAGGRVLAVLFGGRAEGDTHVLVGVPATDAARLLAAVRR